MDRVLGGMDVRNMRRLVVFCVLMKVLMVCTVFFIPVEYVAHAIGSDLDDLKHNWRYLNKTYDDVPVGEKFGYTFDSKVYVDISRNWYGVSEREMVYFNTLRERPEGFDKAYCKYNWPFVYPVLIGFLSGLTGDVLAGLLVTNVASIIALILFYIVSLEYLGSDSAFRASILFSFYPYNVTTWVSSASEPLFLIFVLLAWMMLKKKRVVVVGFLLFLASLTRWPGMMLFPILSLIHVRREYGRSSMGVLMRSIILLNIFCMPLLYWMFIEVPGNTGFTLTEITEVCSGYVFKPFMGLLGLSMLGIIFSYFALVGAYYLKGVDKDLMIYALCFMAYHTSISGGGDSIGRYIGVIWPLFIYYGRELDRKDVIFFTTLFIIMSAVMVEFKVNMMSWI
ncbi:MAG: hypothetical protein ABIH11_05740 [Candidatus Altiarchaeota archaeon]